MDELGYERMAWSFAHTGHFSLFGKGGLAYSPLYPILLSPIYALTSSMHTAYEWAKVENAVLISLSVFPVYAIARFVLRRGRRAGRGRTVAARAADALQRLRDEREPRLPALPRRDLGDAAGRPPAEPPRTTRSCSPRSCSLPPRACSWSCSFRQLSRPSCSSRCWGRSQRRDAAAPSAGRSGRTGSCSAPRPSPWSQCSCGGRRTADDLPLAGRYANLGTTHADPVRVLELFFQHLAELDFAVGVVPFAAALLAGYALVALRLPRKGRWSSPRSRSPRRSGSCSRSPSPPRSSTRRACQPRPGAGATDLPRIHERYLIYLVPLFLVALFAALPLLRNRVPAARPLRGRRRSSIALPAAIPFGDGHQQHERRRLLRAADLRPSELPGRSFPPRHATLLILALSGLRGVRLPLRRRPAASSASRWR